MPRHRSSSNASVSATYSHVSTFRLSHADLQLYSPSLMVPQGGGPIPVFHEYDVIKGKLTIDRSCYRTGKLFISVEGTLAYSPNDVDGRTLAISASQCSRRQHTFFSVSTALSVSPPRNSSGFRQTFSKRRRSTSSLTESGGSAACGDRWFPFEFQLPGDHSGGEGLPPSFVSTANQGASSESLEIKYKVKVIWESPSPSELPISWEVPVLIHPDAKIHSFDVLNEQDWLELPLRSDRPIPFRSAVTLPTSVTFPRASPISYFVVFATTPRSPELVKEIAADATISVSLNRQVTVVETVLSLPTPPGSPTSSSEESDGSHKSVRCDNRLGHSKTSSRSSRTGTKTAEELTVGLEKPLPQLPIHTVFTETRTMDKSICIGFPKRPRLKVTDHQSAPVDSHNALPDGLHKGDIPLDGEMLPCIDWPGLSIKYYLDVSVLVGQDDLRARIPVQII